MYTFATPSFRATETMLAETTLADLRARATCNTCDACVVLECGSAAKRSGTQSDLLRRDVICHGPSAN